MNIPYAIITWASQRFTVNRNYPRVWGTRRNKIKNKNKNKHFLFLYHGFIRVPGGGARYGVVCITGPRRFFRLKNSIAAVRIFPHLPFVCISVKVGARKSGTFYAPVGIIKGKSVKLVGR